MDEYVALLHKTVLGRDYDQLADLLWIPAMKSASRPTSTAILGLLATPLRAVNMPTGVPLAEMLNSHIRLLVALSSQPPAAAEACKCAVSALQELLKNLTSESRREVSLLKRLCDNLFHLSIMAGSLDREEAARHLSRAFTTAITDRAPLSQSKKWASIHIANLLFRLYFRLGTIRLCHNIVRAIDTTTKVEFPPLSQFPKAEVVTYCYFGGRLAMNQSDFKKAEELFQNAVKTCSHQFAKQKRELMVYFVLVKMIHGHLPHPDLLTRHGLDTQFHHLALAVRTGDLRLFDQVLLANQSFYMKKEIFLVIQLQLRNLILRSFYKKLYLIGLNRGMQQENRLNLRLVEFVLATLGIPDMTIDEVECIAANLIFHVQELVHF
ncbi:hypothetical protein PSACC_02698 [Paramicrosporidium saccamoebae]|uniref:26S proteasome non-ATPase regulatory subunit 3 N-terminal TPR repeats domain-containing protein n=1 Tax=Paramicrosporidium saccamoebae TaxID=1246581 RepID=A0A2H9TIB5_9FUNG|nr:hypothetical protein PSACC_02698 [Paramicrosporidium saccamoebae]